MTKTATSFPDLLRSNIQKRVEREDQARKTRDRLESLLMEGLDSELSEMTSSDWDDIRTEVKRRRN